VDQSTHSAAPGDGPVGKTNGDKTINFLNFYPYHWNCWVSTLIPKNVLLL
jgi:hypothetical protein